MQRIKHHYCWIKAHSSATAIKSDIADPARYMPSAGSNGASMQLYWTEGGALLSQAQALTPPPSPGDDNVPRWGPKSAPSSHEDVAWGPKSSPAAGDDVAWGPKSAPPSGDDGVAWGPKSAQPPGEPEALAAAQETVAAMGKATAAGLDGQRTEGTDAKKPYWGPKAAGMEYAGATLVGGWQFEHALVGKGADGIRMSFSVVLGDRRQALGWLADADGQAWSADALAISLICFAAAGDF
jgi:hypothetical protein